MRKIQEIQIIDCYNYKRGALNIVFLHATGTLSILTPQSTIDNKTPSKQTQFQVSGYPTTNEMQKV